MFGENNYGITAIAFLGLLLLLHSLPRTEAKVYKKCSLFWELLRLGVPRSQVVDWVCIAQYESAFNTRAVHTNNNLTKDWGLFQINDALWCDPKDGRASQNVCSIACNEMLGSDIRTVLRCAQRVKDGGSGFSIWPIWKRRCQGRRHLNILECF